MAFSHSSQSGESLASCTDFGSSRSVIVVKYPLACVASNAVAYRAGLPSKGSAAQKDDGGLDQEYDPLPESTIVVDTEEDMDRDTSPPPKQRGRPKGSKNKPKDPAPFTIRLGSESPSQLGLSDQIDQESSSQGSGEMAPNQGSQDQTPLDPNRRVTRSHTQVMHTCFGISED
jgi:hypothetical protein